MSWTWGKKLDFCQCNSNQHLQLNANHRIKQVEMSYSSEFAATILVFTFKCLWWRTSFMWLEVPLDIFLQFLFPTSLTGHKLMTGFDMGFKALDISKMLHTTRIQADYLYWVQVNCRIQIDFRSAINFPKDQETFQKRPINRHLTKNSKLIKKFKWKETCHDNFHAFVALKQIWKPFHSQFQGIHAASEFPL